MKGLLMKKLLFRKTALLFAVFVLCCGAGCENNKTAPPKETALTQETAPAAEPKSLPIAGKTNNLEWETLKDIALEDTPKDIALTKDSATAYVLCTKSIQVVSLQSGKITNSIPAFSKIALSAGGGMVFLTDKKNNQISVIQISEIYDIEIGNSAVIGNRDAKANVVAFLDYQ